MIRRVVSRSSLLFPIQAAAAEAAKSCRAFAGPRLPDESGEAWDDDDSDDESGEDADEEFEPLDDSDLEIDEEPEPEDGDFWIDPDEQEDPWN